MEHRRGKIFRRGLWVTVLILGLMLSGCNNGGNDPPPTDTTLIPADQQVIVVMGPGSEPEAGFDPCYGWGAGEHAHEPLIQSTLLVTNTDLTIGYDLATDYQVSPDGLSWTVTIRDDVRFTDGEPLTAADVVFTYETVKAHTSLNDLTMLERCEALDETTVVFHMVKPHSTFAYTMTIVGIIPEHAYGPDYARNPIGSGRYILSQWDPGQQVILTANEDYYGVAPQMKQVTVLFMSEDAAFAAAKAGQVDVAYTAATFSDQSIPGMRLDAYASVDNRGISMPVISPSDSDSDLIGNVVTSDLAIRQSLAWGLNRNAMAEAVLNGYGTPAYSVCDGLPWYNPAAEILFDRDRAIAILEEAGWQIGDDGIREKDGIKAEFELMYPAGDSVRQAIAMETSNQSRNLGIQINPIGLSWDEVDQRVAFTPMLYGWGANNPMELYNLYYTGVPYNKATYSNPVIDAYMDAALEATDLETSYALWQQAQWDGTTGIIPEGDYPWVWLLNIDHLYWVKEGLDVAEQKIHPHGHGWSVVNNIDQWSWNSQSDQEGE